MINIYRFVSSCLFVFLTYFIIFCVFVLLYKTNKVTKENINATICSKNKITFNLMYSVRVSFLFFSSGIKMLRKYIYISTSYIQIYVSLFTLYIFHSFSYTFFYLYIKIVMASFLFHIHFCLCLSRYF